MGSAQATCCACNEDENGRWTRTVSPHAVSGTDEKAFIFGDDDAIETSFREYAMLGKAASRRISLQMNAPRSQGGSLSSFFMSPMLRQISAKETFARLISTEDDGMSTSFVRKVSCGEDPSDMEEDEELWRQVLDALEHHDELVSNVCSSDQGDDPDLDEEESDEDYDNLFNEASPEEEEQQYFPQTKIPSILRAGSTDECASMALTASMRCDRQEQLETAWRELKKRRLPPDDVARIILKGVNRFYSKGPALVRIDRPQENQKIIVVGDLHGHFGDLRRILEDHGEPDGSENSTMYIFNGDFVDRGNWGPECLLCIYCMKLMFPDSVHLNRGNHEDLSMNKQPRNGFKDQCTRAWPTQSEAMYELCKKSFKSLPLAHVVGDEVFVVHGGLPLDTDVTLDEIASISRKTAVPTSQTSLCGYPKLQRVKAKMDLEATNGDIIKAGTPGVLLHKDIDPWCVVAKFGEDSESSTFRKTTRKGTLTKDALGKVTRSAIRRAEDTIIVEIKGAPELECEVNIIYRDDYHRQEQREHRIFASLLWSDPCHREDEVGPNTRGAGCSFNRDVTQAFLQHNNLKMILRSHEKRAEGYLVEHRSRDGSTLMATIFSASNYPSGSGEPDGNKASVVVLTAREQASLVDTFHAEVGWRESYTAMSHWTGPTLRDSTASMLKVLNGDVALPLLDEIESVRQRALNQLRLLIYCRRGLLLSYFNKTDKDASGLASPEQWVNAMRTCIIYLPSFPWAQLAPYLAHFNEEGFCRYAAFLARYENALSAQLAEQWYGRALLPLVPSGEDVVKAASEAWDRIDKKQKRELSFQELKPLLTSRDTTLSAEVEDERVFSILSSLDANRSGFVDRDEFMRAVMVEKTKNSDAFEINARNADACWSAVQGVLQVLSSCRVRIVNVFRLFDEDGSDAVSREEFGAGLRRLLHGSDLLSTINNWEPLLWKLLDADGSDFISPVELTLALTVEDKGDDESFEKYTMRRLRTSHKMGAIVSEAKRKNGSGGYTIAPVAKLIDLPQQDAALVSPPVSPKVLNGMSRRASQRTNKY